MIQTYIVGALSIAGLALAWLAVQRAWHKTFSDECTDADPLAGRSSCGVHECTETCARHPDTGAILEEAR